MKAITSDEDHPISKFLEKGLPAGWEYREVPEWEDGVLEYRRNEKASRCQPSVKVFDTDFDQYYVRLDTGEYGAEIEDVYVDSVEEAFEKMNSLAADYNVRHFMEGF